MTLQEIIDRLTADGYSCAAYSHKDISVAGFGEVELAYGEARLYDAKNVTVDYGAHACFKTIDELFEDIHNTWPLEPKCETSLPESEDSSTVSPTAPATVAVKDDVLVIATQGESNDSDDDEPGSVQVGDQAPPVCVGLDAEQPVAPGS